MDWWAIAIKRNHEALIGIVAALFAMLGLNGSGSVGRIPRGLHRRVLRVLWPAESAVRRLIIIAARGLVVKLPASRPMPQGRIIGKGGGSRSSFQLFDQRKRFGLVAHDHTPAANAHPRNHGLGGNPQAAAHRGRPEPDDGLVDAETLCRRLQTLKLALENLPRQAKRFARWRARREKMPAPKFRSPLRPGPPPGGRRKPVLEVEAILAECHELAFDALKPDTS